MVAERDTPHEIPVPDRPCLRVQTVSPEKTDSAGVEGWRDGGEREPTLAANGGSTGSGPERVSQESIQERFQGHRSKGTICAKDTIPDRRGNPYSTIQNLAIK
jgi:hypothetical protein